MAVPTPQSSGKPFCGKCGSPTEIVTVKSGRNPTTGLPIEEYRVRCLKLRGLGALRNANTDYASSVHTDDYAGAV